MVATSTIPPAVWANANPFAELRATRLVANAKAKYFIKIPSRIHNNGMYVVLTDGCFHFEGGWSSIFEEVAAATSHCGLSRAS
jgi:hypothetical protein